MIEDNRETSCPSRRGLFRRATRSANIVYVHQLLLVKFYCIFRFLFKCELLGTLTHLVWVVLNNIKYWRIKHLSRSTYKKFDIQVNVRVYDTSRLSTQYLSACFTCQLHYPILKRIIKKHFLKGHFFCWLACFCCRTVKPWQLA